MNIDPTAVRSAKEGQPGLIYAAIAAMVADLSKAGLAKDSVNKFDNYAYRSVDALRQAIGHLQGVHGVAILPTMLECTTTERETKDGRVMVHTVVRMAYRFVAAADGSSFAIETHGEGADRGDKSIGKAASAAYKIAMLQVFAVGDGTDADAESPEIVKPHAEPPGRSKAGRADLAQVLSETDACEIEASLRDAIESADNVADLEAVSEQVKALPESIRTHLRRPWKRRHDELLHLKDGGDA